MPAKKTTKKIPTKKSSTSVNKQMSTLQRITLSVKKKASSYLARRPHRSFRQTKRRDYVRSLTLPGYVTFTHYVWKKIWDNRRLFVWVVVVYSLLTLIFIGMASQDRYIAFSDTLRSTGSQVFGGDWGEVGQVTLLLLGGITGNFIATEDSSIATPSEVSQVYGAFFGLMTWLTTTWLLRGLLAGQNPRFRDGLYNGGAAIIPTFLVALVLVVQLIPAAIAMILFTTGITSGFTEGAVAMLFAVAALLLFVLSLYWTVSTLMALVIVTLPGMYPMRALRTAGDLVIGRRLRILYRWLWLAITVGAIWIGVMIVVILFDTWLKALVPVLSWLPVVPLSLLLISSFSVVFASAYVYLLYRRVVEDDAKPA